MIMANKIRVKDSQLHSRLRLDSTAACVLHTALLLLYSWLYRLFKSLPGELRETIVSNGVRIHSINVTIAASFAATTAAAAAERFPPVLEHASVGCDELRYATTANSQVRS